MTAYPVGTGQMSVSLRARYQVASPVQGLPESVIVKIPSPDRDVRKLACGGYRAEIDFYEDLAPTVAVRAPRCHLAVANADAAAFTLVLEALASAVQGDQVAGAAGGAGVAAARTRAGVPGPRWCDPPLRDARWAPRSGPDPHRRTAGLVARALPQLAERLGPAMSQDDRATLERAAAAL